MAEHSSLISVENAVSGFLLRYKKPTEDYITFLEHACILLQDFFAYDSPNATSEKISVDANGIIEIPTYFATVKDVCVARNGEWWPMTLRTEMVNTTTTTGGVEGLDTTFGEGVVLEDNQQSGYGARGGVNSYYYMIDWKARRIFVDGLISDTVVLRGTTTGLQVGSTTYMPNLLIPILDAYLLWKETFWIDRLVRDSERRERKYHNERARYKFLLNSLSASQWKDLLWGLFTITPQR